MHGRKKVQPSQAEVAALAEKAKNYSLLSAILLQHRTNNDFTKEALDLTTKMLKMNPDFYTLWNYRRDILMSINSNVFQLDNNNTNSKIDSIEGNAIRDDELYLSAEGIKKNPKSYGAWHHRHWITQTFEVNYQSELDLCSLLLKEDQRNFHCWNYRRYVAITAGIDPLTEHQYSTDKINENFSNYSAFHHRSVVMKQVISKCDSIHNKLENLKAMINDDISIVENAVFTEPDDQSAWWYLQFLLNYIKNQISLYDDDVGSNNNANDAHYVTDGKEWFHLLLLKVLELSTNLIEIEETCKWPMIAIVNTIDILFNTDESYRNNISMVEQRNDYLIKLIEIDPHHKNRYTYLLKI